MKDNMDIRNCRKSGYGGAGGAVYGLGFLGAVIYFIQHATDFWNGALGIVKAMVWPAIVVYKALEFFRM